MKTADLIARLAKDFRSPAEMPPARRTLLLAFGTAVATAFVFGFFHRRPDLGSELRRNAFILSASGLFLGWLAFNLALGRLEIPGRKAGIALAPGALVILALIVGFLATGLGREWTFSLGLDPSGLACSLNILALGALPLLWMILRLRTGAPTRISLSGATAGLAAAAAGAFALQFSCANDHPIHLLTWHLALPYLALGLGGMALARLLLRW